MSDYMVEINIELTPEEIKFLEESKKCEQCGHSNALHNFHCCEFCQVPGCKCAYGSI